VTGYQWYVKVARGGGERIVFVGDKQSADQKAAELNYRYQTDEYYVDAHDPLRVIL
jgi:hypothetical protein